MKIKKIEIKNFRQFKGQNIIDFNTDGKITVILGDNGTGKTTLMQFFNWVFYGNYYFDNDVNAYAVFNALSLKRLLHITSPLPCSEFTV